MTGVWGERLRRGIRRSPAELIRRLGYEWSAQAERWRRAPAVGLTADKFAALFGDPNLGALVDHIAERRHPAWTNKIDLETYERCCPGDAARIRDLAERARGLEVSILGSGPVKLGRPIEWRRDIRNNVDWPAVFFRDIDILDQGRTSDIKLPWELSRLQWLIPVAQSYLLEDDAGGAAFAKEVIGDWIDANPYALGPNWASTMEAGMRIFSWTWFFHVFGKSAEWREPDFQFKFLRALYQHGVFVERHLEAFGGDGNHLTADAAALCVVGGFFGGGPGERWMMKGWETLLDLLPVQVPNDGVCFEGSSGYHRLVAELYLIAVRVRSALGHDVPEWVTDRLARMGHFTAACTGPDGQVPAWGDGDDGRVLCFGGQAVLDHSYLPNLLGSEGTVTDQAVAELVWWNGAGAAESYGGEAPEPVTGMFENSGVLTLKGERDLVFVDAGPVGFLGRGGHGHNDCLAIDVCLDGMRLLTDSGSFVYTESLVARDQFRATGAHSTPQLDGAEQNRFVPGEPFRLRDDVNPEIVNVHPGRSMDGVRLRHDGFMASGLNVVVERELILDKMLHRLLVRDTFLGQGNHNYRVPFHLAPGVSARSSALGRWLIENGEQRFTLICLEGESWAGRVEEGEYSPSYGVRVKRPVLVFQRDGGPQTCTTVIASGDIPAEEIARWVSELQLWSEPD